MTDYIKLYQGSAYSYIHWPYGLLKKWSCFRLDRKKKIQQTFSSSLTAQWFNEIRHIIINVGSDMMAIFRLLHQKAIYIDWIEKF